MKVRPRSRVEPAFSGLVQAVPRLRRLRTLKPALHPPEPHLLQSVQEGLEVLGVGQGAQGVGPDRQPPRLADDADGVLRGQEGARYVGGAALADIARERIPNRGGIPPLPKRLRNMGPPHDTYSVAADFQNANPDGAKKAEPDVKLTFNFDSLAFRKASRQRCRDWKASG